MLVLQTNHLGVDEINDTELLTIEGGFPFLIPVLVGLTIAAGTAIMRDWDDFTAGLSGGCQK